MLRTIALSLSSDVAKQKYWKSTHCTVHTPPLEPEPIHREIFNKPSSPSNHHEPARPAPNTLPKDMDNIDNTSDSSSSGDGETSKVITRQKPQRNKLASPKKGVKTSEYQLSNTLKTPRATTYAASALNRESMALCCCC